MRGLSSVFSTTLLAAALLGAQPAQAQYEGIPVSNGDDSLWVGNSLIGSKSGGLGAYVESALLAGAAQTDIDRRRINQWGESLQVHYLAQPGDYADGGKTDMPDPDKDAHQYIADGINGSPWEFIVFQDYARDLDDQPLSASYIRKFVQEARFAGAQPVLMARWVGHFDNTTEASFRETNLSVQAHYDALGEELAVPVAPLARIWLDLIENPPQSDLDPWWLFSDAVHQNEYGKAVNTYAFYSILSRRSPVDVPLVYGGYDDSAEPDLDYAIEQRVWQFIQQREDWAGDSSWTPPSPSGSVTATWDENTGAVSLEVTGEVTAIQFGTPAKGEGAGLISADNVSIDGEAPVQSDTELVAWHDASGYFTPGTYSLGSIVDTSATADELFLTYTTSSGAGSVGTINAGDDGGDPDPDPDDLTITVDGSDVSLDWPDYDGSGNFTNYRVYRDGEAIDWWVLDSEYTDTGLADGTYSYEVVAWDNDGKVELETWTGDATVDTSGGGDDPPGDAVTSLYLEAENATSLGSLWQTDSDSDASNGSYIEVAPGNNSTTSAPGSDGIASYTLSNLDAGTYVMWGRTIAPSAGDDSFWVRIDGGTWVNWNNIANTTTWNWDSLHDGNAGNPVSWTLSAGDYTLEVGYREDGTQLDRIYVTADGDSP